MYSIQPDFSIRYNYETQGCFNRFMHWYHRCRDDSATVFKVIAIAAIIISSIGAGILIGCPFLTTPLLLDFVKQIFDRERSKIADKFWDARIQLRHQTDQAQAIKDALGGDQAYFRIPTVAWGRPDLHKLIKPEHFATPMIRGRYGDSYFIALKCKKVDVPDREVVVVYDISRNGRKLKVDRDRYGNLLDPNEFFSPNSAEFTTPLSVLYHIVVAKDHPQLRLVEN